MMKSFIFGMGLLLCVAGAARAQVMPQDLKWGPAPPIFPKGAQIAVLAGDPFKAGPFVIRLKMPAGYRIPAHHHPQDENVTVIEGDFSLGMGERLDEAKGATLGPGGFATAMANMNHYAWTMGGTVVQVHAEGPFGMVYVDPADDPTRR
jgi:quercetin dioxygenase-like cupin family protein